jgi:hypothetical protein
VNRGNNQPIRRTEMSRYAISGAVVYWPGEASSGADNASCGAVLLVHGTATSTLASRKKTFFLRGLWVHPVASALTFGLSDGSCNATNANAAPQKKFVVSAASSTPGADASNVGAAFGGRMITFPAPGLKFTTNCLVYLVSGSGATAGSIGGCGYEE